MLPVCQRKLRYDNLIQPVSRQTGVADDCLSSRMLPNNLYPVPQREPLIWINTEVGAVLKSNAEKNIDLVQEYVHKLADAKDFQDAFRAQSEFIQSQFTAIGEQTKSLGEACGKSAASVFAYPFKNVA